jgi:hypothetical protein
MVQDGEIHLLAAQLEQQLARVPADAGMTILHDAAVDQNAQRAGHAGLLVRRQASIATRIPPIVDDQQRSRAASQLPVPVGRPGLRMRFPADCLAI